MDDIVNSSRLFIYYVNNILVSFWCLASNLFSFKLCKSSILCKSQIKRIFESLITHIYYLGWLYIFNEIVSSYSNYCLIYGLNSNSIVCIN